METITLTHLEGFEIKKTSQHFGFFAVEDIDKALNTNYKEDLELFVEIPFNACLSKDQWLIMDDVKFRGWIESNHPNIRIVER